MKGGKETAMDGKFSGNGEDRRMAALEHTGTEQTGLKRTELKRTEPEQIGPEHIQPQRTGQSGAYPGDNTDKQQKEQQQERRRRALMQGDFGFFGGAGALYACFYTFCLYRNASGITYPFFVAGTLFFFYSCTKRSGVPWKKDSGFYLASILLLGVSVFLTDNGVIHLFTKAGILILTLSLMLHQYLRDEDWGFSRHLSAMGQSLIETVCCLGCPVSDGNGWLKEKEQSGKKGKGRYVILGLLILIPLLLVVLALLVSADAVFRNLFIRLFFHISPFRITGVLFMTLAAFWGSYCFMAMLNKRVIQEESPRREGQEPVLAITVTSVLAVVYLIFCGIQIVYLFLGRLQLPAGYTYSSYARQGFFQLLAVCVINLALVLVCLAFFRENRVLKGILTVISLCTYVLVASSAYRMLLYIRYCQLTFLRILVLWALCVIAAMLTGIIVSIYRPSFRLFRYLTVTVTVCYLLLAFARPDYWIARYNMGFVNMSTAYDHNAPDDSYRDLSYLAGLSADAAPVLASPQYYSYLKRSSYAMEDYFFEMEARAREGGLRGFNLSRYLAGKAVEQAQQEQAQQEQAQQ